MEAGLLCDESTLLDASELEAMLKAVPGVTAVSTKPTGDYRKRKPNNFGVTYKFAAAEQWSSSDEKVGVHGAGCSRSETDARARAAGGNRQRLRGAGFAGSGRARRPGATITG